VDGGRPKHLGEQRGFMTCDRLTVRGIVSSTRPIERVEERGGITEDDLQCNLAYNVGLSVVWL
jgi:hypothetical protein